MSPEDDLGPWKRIEDVDIDIGGIYLPDGRFVPDDIVDAQLEAYFNRERLREAVPRAIGRRYELHMLYTEMFTARRWQPSLQPDMTDPKAVEEVMKKALEGQMRVIEDTYDSTVIGMERPDIETMIWLLPEIQQRVERYYTATNHRFYQHTVPTKELEEALQNIPVDLMKDEAHHPITIANAPGASLLSFIKSLHIAANGEWVVLAARYPGYRDFFVAPQTIPDILERYLQTEVMDSPN